MSVSGIIDSTNNDPDYKGKIYPDLIAWNHPEGQQGLGSVLQINSSAFIPNTTTAQDATDFATLGCVKIETGTVGMGNQPALIIGEAGDLLQIKGATLLGSILAGNGVNTETLPLGTNGYVLTADSGQGVGVKWSPAGGAGVASITAGNNIGVNNAIPTAPVVSLLSPLTSTLNIGTQNLQGTTSQITLTNGGSQAVQQATTGFTSVVSATPSTKANLFNTSITIETSTNKVDIRPTQIVKTGASIFTIQNNGQLSLSGNGAGSDGVVIQQSVNVGTALTTPLSNVKYYPDTYLTNNNSSTVAVPAPQVINQRLTLNNLGLTNVYQWNDYNNPVFSGYSAFTIDSNNYVWLAEQGTGNIQVWDNALSTQYYTITVAGGGSSGPKVNVFYEAGGYMWIGGIFDSVNGNATPQYSITRITLAGYTEDPVVDGFNFIYGVLSGGEVLTIYEDNPNGLMLFGGNFQNFSNGGQAYYIASIASPFVGTGSQQFAEFNGGMNNIVYAIYVDSNRVFVGGDFTVSGFNSGSPVGYQYCSYWDWTSVAWLDTALNTLNAPVYAIEPTPYGYIWLGGVFNAPATSPYNIYIENATPQNWVDTQLNLSAPIYRSQSFGQGSNLAVMNGPNLYESSAFQQWNDLNTVGGIGNVKGINSFNGGYKVIYDNYNYLRTLTILTHACIFIGSFKYDNTSYGNYTITTRNVSQQFIGDANCSFWSIIGQGVGTFS